MIDTSQLLNSMTLDEKIGQLFLLAFSENRIDEARVLFQDYFVGASYISNDNVPDPDAAVALTSKLQQYAASTRLKIPLLLGADQEGSWGVMVPASSTGPGNMALGAAQKTSSTTRMYRVIGQELSAVGLNTVFAPCADCNSNPFNSIIGMRAFGEKPMLVGALTAAAVQGAHEGGVAVSIKHFPGHGDTTSDSHRGLPTVTRTRDELNKIDLYPFIQGIQAGADIVMTSHIIFSALDPDNPATLSRTILQDILRGELGFEGVVLSDSMNMQAMKRNYRPDDSAIRALLAGVDMIMLAEEHYDHDAATYLKQQTALISAVKAAIESDAIPVARVDQAVTRILKLKEQRGLLGGVPEKSQADVLQVGNAEHRAVELEVSREAVAILRNKHGLVPIPRNASITLVNTTKRDSYAILASTRGIGPNQIEAAFDYFVEAIHDMFASIRVVAAEDVLSETAEFGEGPIIAVTENYPLPGVDFDQASQVQILQRLSAQYQDRLIVAALRDPYELRLLPRVDTYVCGFSFRPSAAQAVADVLSGQQSALGKSPVSVPDTEVAANEVIQH